jgi:hypothetical protein
VKISDLDSLVEEKKLEYLWKLMEMRFDYGWNYFDSHAKQRTTMLNFFILFSGILANAYVLLVKDKYLLPSIIVAFLGIFVAIMFNFIDRRNEELVHMAEDVLLSLEKDVLFKDYKRLIEWPRRRNLLGSMGKSSLQERQIGIFIREEADERDANKSLYSHGIWLPWIHKIIALFFLICCIYSAHEYFINTKLTTILPHLDDLVGVICIRYI